jgi:hypothetical protein
MHIVVTPSRQQKTLCRPNRGRSRPSSVRSLVPKTARALFAFAFCLSAALSQGASPTNDVCSGAELIPGDAGIAQAYYTSPKDISLATTNGDPVAPCQAFVTSGIWYTFTPNATAFYTISTCNDAPTVTTVTDTVMAIYSTTNGCGSTLTSVECDDDACGSGGLQSSITTPLVGGVKYFILVWRYDDDLPSEGQVQLRVTRAIRPQNDTCSGAIQVPLNFPVSGSTIGAGNNYVLPAGNTCFSGTGQTVSTAPGRDVVYSFVAPRAGDYNFRVSNYSIQNNLVLYVADSCPTNNLVTITNCLGAANRSSASDAEEVIAVTLAADQRVYIFVDEHSTSAGSSFTFQVNPCYREREPNNSPENASRLYCGVTGSIQPGSDVDFYALGAPPANSRAFVFVDGSAASTTDFDVRVTTGTDTLEYDDRDNDTIFGVFSPNLAGVPLTGEQTYVRVDFKGAATEPYHVYAVVQPPVEQAITEIEPNETPEQAMAGDKNYFRGDLGSSDNADLYTLFAHGSELVFVSLDGDPARDITPVNARLELLDEFGNILITVDDDNSVSTNGSGAGSLTALTPRSPGEAFVYRIANDGTYFVRVSISPGTTNSAAAGDYLLSISKNCFLGSEGTNLPPVITSITSPGALEGETSTLNVTIADPDSWQIHRIVIDWMDGSSPTTNVLGAGVGAFSAEHLYFDNGGPAQHVAGFTPHVFLEDEWGAMDDDYGNVLVTNVAPSFVSFTATSPVYTNAPLSVAGSFFDPNPFEEIQVNVSWGDGTSDSQIYLPGTTTNFNFAHSYTAPGTNLVTVRLQDDDLDSVTNIVTVVVQTRSTVSATLRTIQRMLDGTVSIQLEGAPSTVYHLEYSADLKTWTPLPELTTDANGRVQFVDAGAVGVPQRFYRGVSP